MFGNIGNAGNAISLVGSLINSFLPLLNNGGSNQASSIFSGNSQDLQGLNGSFNELFNNSGSNNVNQRESSQNNFILQLLKADLIDDGEINGSVVKDKRQASQVGEAEQNLFQKENFINFALKLDEQDDGKINGSILQNKEMRELLDKTDDDKINGSFDEYANFLKEHKYDDKEAYNVFNPIKKENQTKIFGKDKTPQVAYNSNDFSGTGPLKKPTVNPDVITGTGTAANAAKIALGERGNKESDGSYHKYTNGRNEAWCADFVNYAFKKANGGKTPWGGDFTSVNQLKSWGESKGLYSQQKDGSGINTGDVAIFKGTYINKKGQSEKISHTGIVTRIDADGTIHTIEGNTSDKVAERSYNPGDSRLTGFVKMSALEKRAA